MGEFVIPAYSAQQIPEDSWLQGEDYAEFRAAYEYAVTQTHAIHALAKCSPSEIWHVWSALNYGIARLQEQEMSSDDG